MLCGRAITASATNLTGPGLSPLKILHVIHSLDPRSGGPSHAIREIVRGQVAAGHQVMLLATTTQSAEPWEREGEYVSRVCNDDALAGCDVYVGKAWGRRKPWSRYAYSPDCARWLRAACRDIQRRPEVVHIHGVFSHVTGVAAAMARRNGIPYVLRPAGCLDRACLQMGRRGLKALYTAWILQRDVRLASGLHVTAQSEADDLANFCGGGRVWVIPHGVNVPPIVGKDDLAANLFRQFPLLKGRQIVLCMGRIHPIKRFSLVVEAVAALGACGRDLALLIAGNDAGDLQTVKGTVRRCGLTDRTVFTGFVQDTFKRSVFAAASVLVHPSVHENFGLSVVEAMAHSVPVVVSPGVAAHVFVDRSGGGVTVKEEATALADAMGHVLSGNGPRMGRRGRAYVESHLSWPAVVVQYDSMYRDVLAMGHASQPRNP